MRFLVLIVFISCNSKYDSSQLLGDWEVNTWTIISESTFVSNKMDFNFKEDGSYTLDYGSKIEKGKYWIAGDYLHTKAHGQVEKKVMILKLFNNEFEMEMNRAGRLEHVVMKRPE